MQLVKWFTVVIPTFEYTRGEITPNIPFGAHVKGSMIMPTIDVGDSYDGELVRPNETDRFRIYLDEGESYSFDVEGEDNGLDSILRLTGHGEREENDDTNGLDPHLDFDCWESGYYTLAVRGYGGDTGEYTLYTDFA
jgi:hypothetical protein